jgi:Methyltransferase domain
MSLTANDPHHWGPIPEVMEWLTNRLPRDAKVLEVGPGHAPFKRADAFVDFAPWPIQGIEQDKLFRCDIATEPLPFEDKSFDFIFCRHVLEDMWNPFHLCKEMERVGKAGYIETPSPIAELTRGVDGAAPPYRGYHHHRWVIWNHDGTLKFVSKYPVIEYLDIPQTSETLLKSERYWNTYLLWDDVIPVNHLQSPLDFDIPRDYRMVLWQAVGDCRNSTWDFFSRFKKAA